jgi:hypothetical protein
MKKKIYLAALTLALTSPVFARNITPITVQGDLTGNVRWTNDQQYLLKGYVYVDSNAVLTIDSGVTVFGDKATKGTLIVERGAKIYANGTKNFPIIFTSNENLGARNYGDWGGVIICGKTPTNWQADHQVEGGPRSLYGGNDPADNSGRLSYVRVEFGGIAFSPNNEVNSISLYAVGSGTQIDHVQCSFSGDDAFEWFGGTVNAKYLVAYKTVDDDFDNDLNFSGKNQFGVAMREPYVADAASGSKAMECDAYQSGTYSGIPYLAAQGNTSIWSNLTLVGPQKTPGTTNHNAGSNIAAIQIRRGAGISVVNSVIVGWPVGLLIDESAAAYGSTTANIASGSLQFRNNILAGIVSSSGPRDVFYVKDGARNNTPTVTSADSATGTPFNPYTGPYGFVTAAAFGNRINAADNSASGGLNLTDPFNLGNPNLLPAATSPALTGADFSAASKATDAFFDRTAYVGAFGADNWMATWTEFNPINANYDVLRTGPSGGVGVKGIESTLRSLSVYPNPSSSFAVLTFDLVERSMVQVDLYDITGKLVKNIFNGTKAASTHSFSIDLSDVQSGLYFARITTNGGSMTAKLTVAK